MTSVTIEAHVEFDVEFLTLFQDDDVPLTGPSQMIGPLKYWVGYKTGFAVSKPEGAEMLTVTFSYEPDLEVPETESFTFVQGESGAFIGDALNDVWVNILAPGAYRAYGKQDPNDPAHVTVIFTKA